MERKSSLGCVSDFSMTDPVSSGGPGRRWKSNFKSEVMAAVFASPPRPPSEVTFRVKLSRESSRALLFVLVVVP